MFVLKASLSVSRLFPFLEKSFIEKEGEKEMRGWGGEREQHSLMEALHAKKAGSL